MRKGNTALGAVERLLRLAVRLGAGQSVTVRYVMDHYDVSWATAKRDLVRLEQALPVVVTGGTATEAKVLRLMPGSKLLPLLLAEAA